MDISGTSAQIFGLRAATIGKPPLDEELLEEELLEELLDDELLVDELLEDEVLDELLDEELVLELLVLALPEELLADVLDEPLEEIFVGLIWPAQPHRPKRLKMLSAVI